MECVSTKNKIKNEYISYKKKFVSYINIVCVKWEYELGLVWIWLIMLRVDWNAVRIVMEINVEDKIGGKRPKKEVDANGIWRWSERLKSRKSSFKEV